MPYKTIEVGTDRPRNVELIRKSLPLYKGIQAFYFFGIFALIAPFIPFSMIFIMGAKNFEMGWGPIVFSFMVFEIIGFILLFTGNRIYQRRLSAFVNGELVKGVVKKQQRVFVFWKSAKDYTLQLVFTHNGKVKSHIASSSKSDLHHNFPVGSEILGLYDEERDAICFPVEFGMLLEG